MKKFFSFFMILLTIIGSSSCKILDEAPPPEEPWRDAKPLPVSILNNDKIKIINPKPDNQNEMVDVKFNPQIEKDIEKINKKLKERKVKTKKIRTPKSFYERLLTEKESNEKLKLTVDFNKVSLADLVVPFAEILGFSYIIDPTIKGEISLKIDQDLSKKEIYQLFHQLLTLADSYCSVDENKVLKILPLEKIGKDNQLDIIGKNGCMATVIRLNHINVKDALKSLKNIVKQDVNAIPLDGQDAILLIDDQKNIQKVQELISLMDKKNRIGWSTLVFDCYNISSSRLKIELEQVLPILGFELATTSRTQNSKKNTGNIEVALVANDRLGLLVMSAVTEEATEEVANWIDLLQREDIGDVEKIFVYPIINSRATDLVEALSVIFTTEGKTISSSGSGSGLNGEQTGASSGGALNSTNINSSNGKNNNGENVGYSSIFDIPVHIFADEINNRLIIRTTPKTYSIVKALLTRIDTVPSQVLIQVLIVEVALTKSTEFGVRFNSLNKGTDILSKVGTNYEGLSPAAKNNYGFTATIANPNNPDEQFAFVKALASRSKVKVISNPQILVESHAEAKISIGDKVPIITSEITNSQSVQPTDSTALVRNIQYFDTGVILIVKPHITKGGLIRIELEQTISLATKTKSSGIDSPTISERILKTKMSLRNGQSVALGGLIRETQQYNQSTIPGISEIPILNWLLGDTQNTVERTELIMLIKGTVVKEESKLDKIVRRYADAVEEIKKFEYEVYHRKDIRKKEEAQFRKSKMPFN